MNDRKLIDQLNQLVTKNIKKYHMPYVDGRFVIIGEYRIKKHAGVYEVRATRSRELLYSTYSLDAAIAIAKRLNTRNNSNIENILELDRSLEKNLNDSYFFKRTFKTTKNVVTREVAETRYEIAKERVNVAKTKLYKFIVF